METPQSFSEGCALQGEVVNWIHVSFTRIISASLTASSGKIYYNNQHKTHHRSFLPATSGKQNAPFVHEHIFYKNISFTIFLG